MRAATSRELRPWVLAARLKTLPAALVPVAVGTALAYRRGVGRPGLALGCAAFALLVQVATNLANDLYDSQRGADTPQRRGPLRVTAAGLVSPAAMRRALCAAMAAAVLVGLPVAFARGPEMVPLGALALWAGWAYTGGPYPFAYHGLGDLFVVLFFGVVAVAGTSYAETGRPDLAAALAGLGVGLLCDNLLVVNNARDVDTDRAVGKRTLAVRFGARFARAQYALQAVSAFALPFALGGRVGLVTLAACPLALSAGARFLRAREGAEFNAALGAAAAALLAYGLALSGALLVPGA
ncbi:MAG TPA: 1,4-dihydroxy-2-naphthoate polyprenyltransferase [Anaeromyxobacteraceae bacterium]|nr:1,4-dihydroxy-2-naphthoate polyprenyltransferase [Anaeromyxobacteraceae bacterium]